MEPEYYLPNDDCANGTSCPGEGVFIPQQIGNTAMDAMFVGSDADTQADLGLANVDSYPLTDEVFPVIYDGALLTLDGLMDCFARKYPERAQLLNALIETQGYQVTFEENPTAAEAELERWIGGYKEMVRRQTISEGDSNRELLNSMRDTLAREQAKLNAMRHWHIAQGRIYLSTRINRNIDVANYGFGDDEDLIDRLPTNEEGADWLNAVMGDWMVRSGIPGATSDEEFTDSRNSRIVWGTVNMVFGAAEVVGGVVLAAGTLGWGTVAGGALTITGFEAITQGIDMWRTPNEASHSTGWLGDGAYAMMNRFGVLDDNDQASFNRYWSFAMLGLSLGGVGVLGYAGDVLQANRAGLVGRHLEFLADAPSRALATARQAIVGVKNARFGQLIVSYAPLPSGRIVINIQRIGRMVAAHWEDLTRLRLRWNTTRAEDIAAIQERRSVLASHNGDFIQMPGGVHSQADAQQMFDRVFAHSGFRADDKAALVSSVTHGGETSSFTLATRVVRLAQDIGRPRNLGRQGYNEFIAMSETFHEIYHAVRLKRWIESGMGTLKEYLVKYRRGETAYYREEVRVELAARAWTEKMIKPRIEAELKHGSRGKAQRLQGIFDEYIEDSDAYLAYNRRRAGL